jgi:transducin (beta)-like 1
VVSDKAAVVNIWDIPLPPTDAASAVAAPLGAKYTASTSTAEMADLTAIDWSPDGQLLAVASYDSVMRILTVSGEVYMTNPQHKVSTRSERD